VGLSWADRESLYPLDGGLDVGEDGDTLHLSLLAALGSDPECADDGRALRVIIFRPLHSFPRFQATAYPQGPLSSLDPS